MPALPGNILSALTQFPQEDKLARAYLQPIDLAPGELPPWSTHLAGSAIAFQYWPESIQDSRSVEWNPRNIPGGSHPIYQWTHGGERRISFTSVFTTDTAPAEELLAATRADIVGFEQRSPYALQADVPLSGLEIGKRDIDLRVVVAWLRWFTYPTYGTGDDLRAYEPAKALLVLPNTKLGHNGTDYIVTVMTQCDITYEAWFPSGFPRIMEVSLEFAEVVQTSQRVRFHDRKDMAMAASIRDFLYTRGTLLE
jgi:hypothetical protein